MRTREGAWDWVELMFRDGQVKKLLNLRQCGHDLLRLRRKTLMLGLRRKVESLRACLVAALVCRGM